jgi:hypothetical protein
MALTRTDTALLLESDDGSFYWVTLVDVGEAGAPAYTPVADAADPQADDGSDGYVPLVASDGTVYRWSLLAPEDGSIQHKFTVSPNQSETTATTIAIELAGTDYDVSLLVTDDGLGNDVVSHLVVPSTPLIVAGSSGGGRRRRRRCGPGWDWWWDEVPQPWGVCR